MLQKQISLVTRDVASFCTSKLFNDPLNIGLKVILKIYLKKKKSQKNLISIGRRSILPLFICGEKKEKETLIEPHDDKNKRN